MATYQMTLRERLIERSRNFLFEIYKNCIGFPDNERFGLTSQLKRASLSILLNIREGFSRYSVNNSSRDLASFLTTAYGSAEEVQEILLIAKSLNYIDQEQVDSLISHLQVTSKLLRSLLKRVKSRVYPPSH